MNKTRQQLQEEYRQRMKSGQPLRQSEYEARNMEGFEGDELIGAEIKKIMADFKLDTIIETGTYLGGTTKRLCEIARTFSIESDQNYFNRAKNYLKGIAEQRLGDSGEILKEVIEESASKRILFFLDAHWGENWPVLKELDTIRKADLNAYAIVIHDFKVPDKEFGYDGYNGQTLDMDYIKDHLQKGVGYYFNEEAQGAQRGVIYITYKKTRNRK